jgi:hypothetical protein
LILSNDEDRKVLYSNEIMKEFMNNCSALYGNANSNVYSLRKEIIFYSDSDSKE